MKRAVDILVAGIAAILLLPLGAVLALLVRLRLGTPILFVQIRPGLEGRPFRLFKFRTMSNATDGTGVPLPDEVRLTSFGRYLRATSLDELPELWNVIRGDMSLVGPRPLLMQYLPLYTKEQRRRHSVRPGITGWAQVHGRNLLSWEEKFTLDLWYVDNRSLLLDLRILLLTFRQVISRRGIAQAGHATAEPYRGAPKPCMEAGHGNEAVKNSSDSSDN